MFYIVHDEVFSDSPVKHSCLDFFMLLWLLLSSFFAGANDITNFLSARLPSHSVSPQWVCSFPCHQRGNRCCYAPHLHVQILPWAPVCIFHKLTHYFFLHTCCCFHISSSKIKLSTHYGKPASLGVHIDSSIPIWEVYATMLGNEGYGRPKV